LGKLKTQETLRDRVLQVAKSQTQRPLVLVGDQGPDVPHATVSYRSPPDQNIDTVLELSVLNIGMVGEEKANPSAALVMTARARLIRVKDNTVLYDEIFEHRSDERTYAEWVVDNALPFRMEFNRAYQSLAEKIVSLSLVSTAMSSSTVWSCGLAMQGPKSEAFSETNDWALIIGIDKYPALAEDKQLTAARKDAEAVAKLLKERYGYSGKRMIELYDEAASRKGIIRAFSSMKRRLTNKDNLFVYYAGHGEYESDGKEKSKREQVENMGYWIPSDAELDDPSTYIYNSQVRDYLANIPARHIYLVADSAFSGSLIGRNRALCGGEGSFEDPYQSTSRWVLASGELYPRQTDDKSKNSHSAFAWHFMATLKQNTMPYLLAKDIAEPVAIRVSNEVKGQLPRSAPVIGAGDEGGQFVFHLQKKFQGPIPDAGESPIVEATLRPFQAPKAKDLAPMVTIPAGEFVMGSKLGEGQPDESPQRAVYLDAYVIDKYEVTVEHYAAYLKKSGAEPPDFWDRVNQKEDGNRPVVGVDWLDAKDYCEYYGKQLPTEAQWEKAARGTDGRKYPWGDENPKDFSVFANFGHGVSFRYSKSLAPVGSYEAGKSPYGVYDMVGNVWEWVQDWYHKDYYATASPKNPAGPDDGEYTVIRGGSWLLRPGIARSAGRMYLPPNRRSSALGFRCTGEAR